MTPFTFTKHERLQRKDFRNKRWFKCSESNHFSLLVHRNEEGKRRVAVTIRKKIGCAVARNRIRRLIKESFRLEKELFPESCDSLIKVKRAWAATSLALISDELRGLLKTKKMPKGVDV